MTNNKKFNNKKNAEFGMETDVNQVIKQNQKAEAKKQLASGLFANNGFQKKPNAMNAEFGLETNVNQVRQQNQQAEAKKQQ
ncbi:gamma-type small acid-soluble spore protein, partial [Solibacillus silvestris]|uniref:gamma-type small acid-soluble spore protein n=1 Tax=Solibacillus silvestris TaxID=76853 RepID=UPI003F7E1328